MVGRRPPAVHHPVQVRTDEGMTGWARRTLGFCAAGGPQHRRALDPLVIGEDPAEPIAVYEKLYLEDALLGSRAAAGRSTIGAMEMALWDIKSGGGCCPPSDFWVGLSKKLPYRRQRGLERDTGELMKR